MSKATQRRERSLSKHLGQLACSNPTQFKKEWRKLLDAWSAEAFRRGNRLRDEEVAETGQLPVYGVLVKASRLLALCGEEADRLVGAATREFLEHDCGKAFSQAVEPHLYWLTNSARNCELMRAGTHRPPR
jgi:hypothetical protein